MGKTTKDVGTLVNWYPMKRGLNTFLCLEFCMKDGGIFLACPYTWCPGIAEIWIEAHERHGIPLDDLTWYKIIPPEDVDTYQRERSREQSEKERQRIIRNRSSDRDSQWTR